MTALPVAWQNGGLSDSYFGPTGHRCGSSTPGTVSNRVTVSFSSSDVITNDASHRGEGKLFVPGCAVSSRGWENLAPGDGSNLITDDRRRQSIGGQSVYHQLQTIKRADQGEKRVVGSPEAIF